MRTSPQATKCNELYEMTSSRTSSCQQSLRFVHVYIPWAVYGYWLLSNVPFSKAWNMPNRHGYCVTIFGNTHTAILCQIVRLQQQNRTVLQMYQMPSQNLYVYLHHHHRSLRNQIPSFSTIIREYSLLGYFIHFSAGLYS